MLACTLDMVASKLFDANGYGDIRLEMLNFVRKKTPDIGGENIVLAVHIRRDGEEPAGEGAGAGTGAGNGTEPCAGEGTGRDIEAAAAAGASAAPVRGKIPEA